jgi:hypothetical protein
MQLQVTVVFTLKYAMKSQATIFCIYSFSNVYQKIRGWIPVAQIQQIAGKRYGFVAGS